ncbi:MAG: hypothetical protein KJ968_00165, partial [Nanoarchaeota archaeon]|nr:hypothetical protein [Nanoarchaeota archaeon]
DLEFTLWDAVEIGHVTRNQLHKPEVSLVVNGKEFMKTKEYHKSLPSCPGYIDVYAISDGKDAYVK